MGRVFKSCFPAKKEWIPCSFDLYTKVIFGKIFLGRFCFENGRRAQVTYLNFADGRDC